MANLLALDFKDSANPSQVEGLRNILANNGVIAFPTETFYGLGADPFNPIAVARLFEIKKRPADNPILVLIADARQLGLFTDQVPPSARKLMQAFWPGPLTLLFPARDSIPHVLTAGTGKIGIRLPGDAFTRRLIEELGPLTAPSANLSGTPGLARGEDVVTVFGDSLEAIVTGGNPAGGSPSTVVDPNTDPARLVREGAISRAALEECLGNKLG